jgi:hypothetical protein
VRFNAQGLIKIENVVSTPRTFEKLRNERLFWSQANIDNFYVQETYRVGLVLLELGTFVPISTTMAKCKTLGNTINNASGFEGRVHRYNPAQLYQVLEKQITMAL